MKLQVLHFSISSDEDEEEDESDRETEDPAIDSLSAAIKYQVNISFFHRYLLLVVIYKKNKLSYYINFLHQSFKIQILKSMN